MSCRGSAAAWIAYSSRTVSSYLLCDMVQEDHDSRHFTIRKAFSLSTYGRELMMGEKIGCSTLKKKEGLSSQIWRKGKWAANLSYEKLAQITMITSSYPGAIGAQVDS